MHPLHPDFFFNLQAARELDPRGRSVRDKLSNICVAIVCCIVFRQRTGTEWLARCKNLGTRVGKVLGRHQAGTSLIGWNWRILIRLLEKHNDTMESYGEDLFTDLLECKPASKQLVKEFLRWAKHEFDAVIDGEEERRLHRTLRDLDLDERHCICQKTEMDDEDVGWDGVA
jgi:hypothetical protein